jgi:large subunit ribosomal protein L13
MIPYKQPKGRVAFKLLKVYVGIPKEFEGQETTRIVEAEPKNVVKSVKLGTVSELLGSKF